MRTKLYATFALALVTAISASTASAQTRTRRPGGAAAARAAQAPQSADQAPKRDPLELILRAKQELQLTEAQESSLKQLRSDLAARNDSLVKQVAQITGRDMKKDGAQTQGAARGAKGAKGTKARRGQQAGQPADRAISDEDRERVKDLTAQIQEQSRTALKSARDILSAEQRQKLQTIMRAEARR